MTTNYIKFATFLLLPFLAAGCITIVKAEKVVDGDEEGQRYNLPQTFIKVKPNSNGDGTFTVTPEYIPDESQAYTIGGQTFMGSLTLEVKRDDSHQELLKQVNWVAKSDAVAVELIKQGAALFKEKIDKRKKEKDDAETENKQKLNAAKTAVKTAETAVTEKERELFLAILELEHLIESGTLDEKTKIQKELAIKTLEAKLGFLEDDLALIKEQYSDYSSAFNIAEGDDSPGDTPDKKKAWGPVLYQVQDYFDESGKEIVKLVAVSVNGQKQPAFEVATLPKAKEDSDDQDEDDDSAQVVKATVTEKLEFKSDEVPTITVNFSKEIKAIDNQSGLVFRDGANNERFSNLIERADIQLGFDNKNATISFKKKLPIGDYTIILQWINNAGESQKGGNSRIKFIVIK